MTYIHVLVTIGVQLRNPSSQSVVSPRKNSGTERVNQNVGRDISISLHYFQNYHFPSFTKRHSPHKASLPSPPFHRLLLCELLIEVSVLRNSRKTNFHFEGMSINNFGEIDQSPRLNQKLPSLSPLSLFFLDVQ